MNRRLASGSARSRVDQPDVLRDQPERRRMNVDAVFLSDMEQAQETHRVADEILGAVHRQPLTIDLEALELTRFEHRQQEGQLRLAPAARLERGDEDAVRSPTVLACR